MLSSQLQALNPRPTVSPPQAVCPQPRRLISAGLPCPPTAVKHPYPLPVSCGEVTTLASKPGPCPALTPSSVSLPQTPTVPRGTSLIPPETGHTRAAPVPPKVPRPPVPLPPDSFPRAHRGSVSVAPVLSLSLPGSSPVVTPHRRFLLFLVLDVTPTWSRLLPRGALHLGPLTSPGGLPHPESESECTRTHTCAHTCTHICSHIPTRGPHRTGCLCGPLSLVHVTLLTFAICPCPWVKTARAVLRCVDSDACCWRHQSCFCFPVGSPAGALHGSSLVGFLRASPPGDR